MQIRLKSIKYHPMYEISKDGKVYSWKYGDSRELKQSEHKGYRRVALSEFNKREIFPVHRLVAQAFIPNPQRKPFINHKDGNKRNNNVANLEWVTREENWKHNKEVLGYSAKGKKNNNYGYKRAKLYPSEELRNRLVELGIPRYRHNLVELGKMLPFKIKQRAIAEGEHGGIYYFYTQKGGDDCFECFYAMNNGQTRLDRTNADTEANARAKMVIYLKENKLC